jgi:hypothetical protein
MGRHRVIVPKRHARIVTAGRARLGHQHEQPQTNFMSTLVSRRNRLRKLLARTEADALLVTNFKNVTYLTGFTGDDSYLLVANDGETLVTDRPTEMTSGCIVRRAQPDPGRDDPLPCDPAG